MAGKIQNEDIKSSAELVAAGGTAAQLPNDTKIYLTALGLNKTLSAAIIAGDIGGSSGSGALQWIDGPTAPTIVQQFATNTYAFASGETQTELCMIQVPSGYTAGKQIKMRTKFYSPDSSGTALLQSVATLVRTGTDAISSTTNQRTSTNTALTLSAGTVNKPQAIVHDLTDATGNINSVAVSAGDIILVTIQRGTDTATSDLQALLDASGVTFNG
jgi:hypothetical protein